MYTLERRHVVAGQCTPSAAALQDPREAMDEQVRTFALGGFG